MEGLPSISWKEQKFFWQFWPELIPWFWRFMPMTILRRLEIISSYQFVVILKFVKISCIFTKYAIKIKWKLEKMSNLHSIDMDMKHQNQGIKLDQNHHIKFCSFQLMEGNPSISWQEHIFFLKILTRIDTLILVLDIHDNSVKVRNFFRANTLFQLQILWKYSLFSQIQLLRQTLALAKKSWASSTKIRVSNRVKIVKINFTPSK